MVRPGKAWTGKARRGSLVIYLSDEVVVHPKLLRAGAKLGEGGVSQAFHLFVLGIAYARQHLTDGFIPDGFVASCGVVSKSSLVGKALSARGIGLWRRVRGGYQIHDYHKFNPKASVVKEKREQDRQRKAAERLGRKLNLSTLDTLRTRARAVPRTTVHLDQERTSTDAPRRLALARGTETPTFALACLVMREALDHAWTTDHDTSLSNAGEYFKALCARRGLAYDGDLTRKAYDACAVAQRRRA